MKAQNGFTLVELAIALMVIGLLIGGVLKGQELIENARITATIRQLKAYDAATLIFRNTYGALPGDIKKPGSRLPDCTEALCNSGGNGNGKIRGEDNGYVEIANFFPHMTKAGLIQGPEGGNDVSGACPDCSPEDKERFFPELPLNIFSEIRHSSYNGSILIQNHVYLMDLWAGLYSIPTSAMIAIDTKLDDGKPLTGSVITWARDTCPLAWGEEDADTEYDLSVSASSVNECEFIVSAEF